MGRDALSGLIFADDDPVWNCLEMTFRGKPFRQMLKQVGQWLNIIFPPGLPRFVVVTVAVLLQPPFNIAPTRSSSLRALLQAVSARTSSASYTVARIKEVGARGLRGIVKAKLGLPSPKNRELPMRVRAVKSSFAATLARFLPIKPDTEAPGQWPLEALRHKIHTC